MSRQVSMSVNRYREISGSGPSPARAQGKVTGVVFTPDRCTVKMKVGARFIMILKSSPEGLRAAIRTEISSASIASSKRLKQFVDGVG